MYSEPVLSAAKSFIRQPLGWVFTPNEARAINAFFTNRDKRVFFMHTLPASVGSTLLAMFSRMKNPRGLRGVFVDSFIPQFLATQLKEVTDSFGGDEAAFLKERRIVSLDTFLSYSQEARSLFEEFMKRATLDPEYLEVLAQSSKAQKFLALWLNEKYGHNSIARTGSLWLCCEKVSILAVKSMEWSRPGAGYIELSTRYVDMSSAGCYPIENELEAGWGIDRSLISKARDEAFATYDRLAGANFDGPFPNFLREQFRNLYVNSSKDLEMGVTGETCDVLGNLLPASALSSVGMCVSGEAFGEVLSHLILDGTPENLAIVELILEETQKIGAQEFGRYHEPTPWKRTHWKYLNPEKFLGLAEAGIPRMEPIVNYSKKEIEDAIGTSIALRSGVAFSDDFQSLLTNSGFESERTKFDKLPSEFEGATVLYKGLMTYRGWRDLQRMGFCTHLRTLLTSRLGFYRYDKLRFSPLDEAFTVADRTGREIEALLTQKGIPGEVRQYPLALGHMIGFSVGANLRQWEFCNWQRSKPSVNHEVRQIFLSGEAHLRDLLPWWSKLSRADTTPAYVFARGALSFPLENKV